MEVQKTALYKIHKNLGAKFAPFAGYEMPIQYSDGIVKEHISTRTYAGFFDVSHMGQFYIEGGLSLDEALEKIIPADLKNLNINQSKYSFLLNLEGGIIDDLIITRRKNGFYIVLNAACKDNDIKHISKNLSENHKFYLCSKTSLIAVQGPKSSEILEKKIRGISNLKFMYGNFFEFEGEKLYATRSGYTGEDGFEISIPDMNAEDIVKQILKNENALLCGLGCRDSLRVEAGLSLYGNEINEDITPIQANLSWALDKKRLKNGNLNGSNILLQQLQEAKDTLKVGITPVNKTMLRNNMTLHNMEKNEIGYITSGCFSPTLKRSIGIGYINNFTNKLDKLFVKVRETEIRLINTTFICN